MRFEQKLTAALGLLASTGMWRSNYAPPLHCLLWKVGAKTPPPHFRSFTANFVSAGLWSGVVWGLLMWFIVWPHKSPAAAFVAALFMGVFSGLCMAAYYRYGARKYGIPLWKDFKVSDEHVRT